MTRLHIYLDVSGVSCGHNPFERRKNALPTIHRPEHGVVVTVADSSRVCETGSPQAGPVPGHLDDGGASHSPNGGDLPALHGHGAGYKDPAQHRHEKAPYLDHTDLHRWRPALCVYTTKHTDHSSTIQFLYMCLAGAGVRFIPLAGSRCCVLSHSFRNSDGNLITGTSSSVLLFPGVACG